MAKFLGKVVFQELHHFGKHIMPLDPRNVFQHCSLRCLAGIEAMFYKTIELGVYGALRILNIGYCNGCKTHIKSMFSIFFYVPSPCYQVTHGWQVFTRRMVSYICCASLSRSSWECACKALNGVHGNPVHIKAACNKSAIDIEMPWGSLIRVMSLCPGTQPCASVRWCLCRTYLSCSWAMHARNC